MGQKGARSMDFLQLDIQICVFMSKMVKLTVNTTFKTFGEASTPAPYLVRGAFPLDPQNLYLWVQGTTVHSFRWT